MVKNKMNWTPIIAILGIIVIAGTIWYASGRQTSLPSALSCDVEPYVSYTIFDGVNTGTEVSTFTDYYKVNGKYGGALTSGSSGNKFDIGDKVSVLLTKDDYIDIILPEFEITSCGENMVNGKIFATDDATLQIKNSVGDVVTNDATGGATNQSESSTNMDVEWKITGNADQSTGDLTCVFEATNTSKVNDLILSGASRVDVPEFYTVAGASSISKAYEVPELVDGESRVYNLRLEPETGQTILNTGVYTTCYSKQALVDVDGSFLVDIEDSDGTNKYEDDFDYDFWVDNS